MLRKHESLFIVGTLTSLLFFTSDANAYIDPGTGSMILQIIIASVLGLSLTIKIFFRKIKSFFMKIRGNK